MFLRGEEHGYRQLDLANQLNDIPDDYHESYTNGFEFGAVRKLEELKVLAGEQGYKGGLNLIDKKIHTTM